MRQESAYSDAIKAIASRTDADDDRADDLLKKPNNAQRPRHTSVPGVRSAGVGGGTSAGLQAEAQGLQQSCGHGGGWLRRALQTRAANDGCSRFWVWSMEVPEVGRATSALPGVGSWAEMALGVCVGCVCGWAWSRLLQRKSGVKWTTSEWTRLALPAVRNGQWF